jgi:hypothetical protein
MRNSTWLRFLSAPLFAAALLLGAGCSDDESSDGGEGREGASCGGFVGDICADGFFCDYPEGDSCGAVDGPGTCRAVPTVCVPVIDEVCGCDGERYSSPCDAQRAGTDVSTSDDC